MERLLLMSEWDIPMTCTELRHLIKAYLDGLGKTTRIVGNLLGPDFVKGFMKRHPTLIIRTTSMTKRARAVKFCQFSGGGPPHAHLQLCIIWAEGRSGGTRPFSKMDPSTPSRSEITRNPRSASCSAELLLANFFRRTSSTRQPTVGRVNGSMIQMVLHTPLLLLASVRALHSQTGSKRFCFQMSRNFEVELKQNLTFNNIGNLSKFYCLNF